MSPIWPNTPLWPTSLSNGNVTGEKKRRIALLLSNYSRNLCGISVLLFVNICCFCISRSPICVAEGSVAAGEALPLRAHIELHRYRLRMRRAARDK